MDTNFEIDKSVENNKNLSDLEVQIKNRILSQFIDTVRKPKLGFWAKYSIPGIVLFPLLGSLILYSYFSVSYHNTSTLLDFAWFMSGIFSIGFPLLSLITNFGRSGGYIDKNQNISSYKTNDIRIIKYFKGYFNFEKEVQSYFSNFNLPLSSESEVRQYMIEKSNKFFCKDIVSCADMDTICKLTSEEIKKLHDINLNSFQKQLLINKIKEVQDLSLIDIRGIMLFDNVEMFKDISKVNKKYLL